MKRLLPLACIVASCFYIPAAFAAGLTSAQPPMNGTVALAPTELDLTFAERIRLKGSGARLVGPDKKAIALAPSSLGSGGETTLVVPVAAPLNTGTYTVEWHVIDAGGRKAHGTYTFTIIQ